MPVRIVTAVTAVGLMLLASGCAIPTGPTPSTPAQSASGGPPPLTSTSPPPTPTSSDPLPTPQPAALPPAADGTNVGACAGGRCEVRVDGPTSIPLNAGFDLQNLRVESINADGITLNAIYTGGSTSTTNCSSGLDSGSATEAPSMMLDCQSGSKATLTKITIEVPAISGSSAILRLTPN